MNKELEKIANVYGDVCVRKKKQRRKRQKLLVIQLFYDYAKNSTLHGFRYIVDNGLTIVERLFWFLTVIVSIALCSCLIYNVVHKWKTSPVIVTVNGRLSSVGSVPFPAVMICPQIKINPQNFNYTEKLKMLQSNKSIQYEKEFTKFKNVNIMCDAIEHEEVVKYDEKFSNSSMVADITEAAPALDDIFFTCERHAEPIFCEDLFTRVITEEGVCYTSNSLKAKDIFKDTIQSDYPFMESNDSQLGWSVEDGYEFKGHDHFYPRRGKAYGSAPDLSIILINDPEREDKNCSKVFSGYKIFLHHPADFPQTSLYYYAALPNQLSSVAISFHEFNSDKDLTAYDSEIRQCYFSSDYKLQYFEIYTASNCQAECLSDFTYLFCKCVGFYMPHHKGQKICHPIANRECMIKARNYMANVERSADLGVRKGFCRCLPACNTVEYDAEILKTEFKIQDIIQNYTLLYGYSSLTSYSKVDLFYKRPHFVTMQRRELYGVTDLLANIGGLLGLFLGFSFLSLIEIFYFLTVRVGFILRRDLQEEKSNEKSQLSDVKTT